MQQDKDFANEVLKMATPSELMPKPGKCAGKVAEKKRREQNQDSRRMRSGYVPPAKSAHLLEFDSDGRECFADEEKRAGASAPHLVSIITETSPGMSDRDLGALLRDGLLVKDSRDEANQAYHADDDYNMQNPSDSGSHELLLSKGEYADVFIGLAPRVVGKGYVRTALVIDKDSGAFGYWWPEQIWAKPYEASHKEEKTWWDKLPAVSSVTPNQTYAIISSSGQSSVAFKVIRKVTGKDGNTELYVQPIVGDPGIKPHRDAIYNDEDVTQFGDGSKLPNVGDTESVMEEPESDSDLIFANMKHIVICDDNRQLRVVKQTLFAPSSAKVVKLKQDSNKLDTWGLHDPMSAVDVQMNLLKAGAQQFTLLRKGSSFHVDGQGPFDRADLLVALVKQAGLRYDDAVHVVSTVPDDKRRRFLVKNAIGYAPPIPEPQTSFDEYSGVMEQHPQDELLPVNLPVGQEDYKYIGKPEKQNIVSAVSTGQKEVFDTSAIASLVRSADATDLITQFLSDIILGADRVNRIMFMFYWMNEQFRDRYGQENLVELEDQLKNVSKSLGDLILFLKQRQVEGSPSFDAMEVELGAR